MPAFPNKAKIANKAAAFQMLLAVALECEYQTANVVDWNQSSREYWLENLFDGPGEESIEHCQCETCEGLTEHKEEDDYPPLKEQEAQHDYYHATI